MNKTSVENPRNERNLKSVLSFSFFNFSLKKAMANIAYTKNTVSQ